MSVLLDPNLVDAALIRLDHREFDVLLDHRLANNGDSPQTEKDKTSHRIESLILRESDS